MSEANNYACLQTELCNGYGIIGIMIRQGLFNNDELMRSLILFIKKIYTRPDIFTVVKQ